MRAARADPDPLSRLIVELLARTGIRKSELLGLTVDAVVQIGSAWWLRIPVGNLHNDRYIPLHPELKSMLDDWIAEHRPVGLRTDRLLVERNRPVTVCVSPLRCTDTLSKPASVTSPPTSSAATIRHELMASCRRHVNPDGVVLLWRHEPGWVRTVEASRSDPVDGIITELHSVEHHGDRLRATVAWEFDGERYEQPFEAVDIDDDALHELAAAHGLNITALLDPNQMLVRLEPVR